MLTLMMTISLLLQTPSPISGVTVTPAVVGNVDMASLKGTPRQLDWSPDGTQLYLQTAELNGDRSIKAAHHYLIALPAGAVKSTDAEPAWAQDYWDWKSNRWAPDDEAFAIELEQTTKRMTATSTPMGGDYARGGTSVDGTRAGGAGTSMDNAMSAAQQSQTVAVNTLRLKGEAVGVWENERPVPGITFGWGPKGSNLIAFADKDGGALIIMDKSGAKKKIDGTKGVVLPAWTADGTRIAYLEANGKNKYTVVVGSVSR